MSDNQVTGNCCCASRSITRPAAEAAGEFYRKVSEQLKPVLDTILAKLSAFTVS